MDKSGEIKRFSKIFGVGVEELAEKYSQIEEQVIGPIEYESGVEKGDKIVGELDEFEKKAICWCAEQSDDLWKDIIADLLCFRVALRLNLSGRFSFKEGGKIVVNARAQMQRQLLESAPFNTVYPL